MTELSIKARAERDPSEDLFRRFFVPRALYVAMSLLFGGTPTNTVALCLPRPQQSGKSSNPLSAGGASSTSVVPQSGACLIGMFDHTRPFRVFQEPAEGLGLPSDYVRVPVADLVPDGPRMTPIGAYLVTDSDNGRRLRNRLAASATKSDARSMGNVGSGNPYTAAEQLLRYIQSTPLLWQTGERNGVDDGLGFDAPGFVKVHSGDRLLNRMAETIVRLGGDGRTAGQRRWRICCILAPARSTVPLHLRNLQILGNSDDSPYDFAEEIPFSEKALSLNAYRSGCVILRPTISISEVLYSPREEPIKSAMAVPIDSAAAEAVGALYVTSPEADAFTADDMLLVRIVGRMVGELLLSYQAQKQLTAGLTRVILNPETMDGFFPELPRFGTENAFVRDLEVLTAQLRGAQPKSTTSRSTADATPGICLIGIDIDRITSTAGLYGDPAIKDVILQIGRRLDTWIGGQGSNISAYRVWADRFFLILRDTSLKEAQERALVLRTTLSDTYELDRDSVTGSSGTVVQVPITTRLAVIEYDTELLRQKSSDEEVRYNLHTRLEATLRAAKAAGGGRVFVSEKGALAREVVSGT